MAVMVEPVGQLVVIGVGAIGKAPGLGNEPDRVDGCAARVPAGRALARHFGVQPYGFGNVAPLVLERMLAIVDPFQPVRGDLPSGLLHSGHLVGRTGECGCHAVAGDRHLCLREQAVKPPEADAGAVFVDRFHVPVTQALPGLRTGDFGKKGFGGPVAMQDAVFAAFLVVYDELHADVGAAWPFRVRRVGPVAAHVSDVTHQSSHPADRKTCFQR
jgi:hypothetical protein